jgi:hypothetical protein
MQQIISEHTGLGLLINLNWDRILYLATLAVALMAGAFIGSHF